MSRYYRELHDRELLTQAELILREVCQRNLIDVFLADGAAAEDELFPRRLASANIENGRLAVKLDGLFFRNAAV
ncbi:MAG: hypothetical protein WA324_17805 [Bryobacteraceae bacterium]